MGNPHCVIPVESIERTPWREIGPKVEGHPAFPRRTNVHFVERVSPREFKVAVWERGSGPTLACGTGASAVCVAMHLLGLGERAARVRLPGGELRIEWSADDGCVYMTGPATEVFTGELA
jgi:diaminopimelate epimerase